MISRGTISFATIVSLPGLHFVVEPCLSAGLHFEQPAPLQQEQQGRNIAGHQQDGYIHDLLKRGHGTGVRELIEVNHREQGQKQEHAGQQIDQPFVVKSGKNILAQTQKQGQTGKNEKINWFHMTLLKNYLSYYSTVAVKCKVW